MRVLSLFDGMACGMIAMLGAGVEVDRYVAYEIDKYAVKTSSHNFPNIEHQGDVFDADFTEYQDFDFLVGGSPCTYWSIAQKNGRETQASGMGWELFQQYVRALHEAKPKYFIYENNKSMSKAIRASIDKAFGFEAVLINSALVSAQNRQRLYWVGKQNADGTYSKVSVEQLADRGILLKDILICGNDLSSNDKSYCMTASYDGACGWNTLERNQRTMVAEPVATDKDGKAFCVTANYAGAHIPHSWEKGVRSMVAERVPPYGTVDKARPLNAHYPNNCGGFEHRTFSNKPNKQQVDMIAEPIRVGALPRPNGKLSTSQAMRIYSTEAKSVNITSGGGGMGGKTGLYAIPLELSDEYFKGGMNGSLIGMCTNGEGKYRNGSQPSQQHRVYSCEGKSQTLNTLANENYFVPIYYAFPCEWDESGNPIKAISVADRKVYLVHKVENGLITIKGKQYPIKLADGYYIIRKLTVSEYKRLQTVPEWYEFPVSDCQAYKMLGNGWTCEVIIHLIKSCLAGKVDDEPEFKEQIKFF